MKKILLLLLSVMIVIGTLVGCNTVDAYTGANNSSTPDEIINTSQTEEITSTEALDTSSTEQTRDESKFESYLSEMGVTRVTFTTATGTSETASSSSNENEIEYRDIWEPLVGHDWLYTPDYETDPVENFDFEITYVQPDSTITVKDGHYSIMPKQIIFTIRNKTGEPFQMMGSPLLECYRKFIFSGRGGWIRAPYFDYEADETITVFEDGVCEYVFDLEKCQPNNGVIYKDYDGGHYRLIFYLNDGPHYVTFIADGPPEG